MAHLHSSTVAFKKMATPNIAAYRLQGKCQLRKALLIVMVTISQGNSQHGCSAGPINQYMGIQTKGLFSPSFQKHFLISQENQKPETLGWLEG